MDKIRYRVAVLGPIPRDHITTYEGKVVEKYGCVLYPVVALSKLLGPGNQILPVTHVRSSDLQPIRDILSRFPNVDTGHITAQADQGDVIRLTYLDQNKRMETQTGFMNPIVPDDVKDLLDADAFVCVPVTDFEIALETLKFIKSNSNGFILFDAHGPTNGTSREGVRFLKFWIDRDLWLPYIDILKMNLEEAACSWFEKEYNPGDMNKNTELALDELPKFAFHCLEKGVKAVYITLDEYGCVVYFKGQSGKMKEHFIKRIQVDKVVDTTGCGDSFAGGLAFGYLKTQDYILACQYGNAMGAQRCASTRLDVYKSLEETKRQIEETYGDE